MSEYDELEAKIEELSLLIIRIEAKTKALELYADLAASKARREALEEAARVCDARYMGDNNREDMEARRCAAAIRALMEKKDA